MQFKSEPHPVHWFRDQYQSKKLILKPPYQRNPVWAARQKNALIESVLLRVPIPEIFIHQASVPVEQVDAGPEISPPQHAKFVDAIVDGQQRTRAVLQFLGLETDPGEEEFRDFVLDKLPTDSPYYGMGFKDLDKADQNRFLIYPFQCRVLETDDEEAIRRMFARLNRYQVALKPQELRHAIYQGPFIELSQRLADDDFWDKNRFFTKTALRRMSDVEFVSELLIALLHGPQGGSAKVIDQYYQQYEDYEDEFPEQVEAEKAYKDALKLIDTIFPNLHESSRWSNRADFYTLFTLVGILYRLGRTVASNSITALRRELEGFGREVTTRLSNPKARVSKQVAAYTRAVEKGVNDRRRRAIRRENLEHVVGRFFKKAK